MARGTKRDNPSSRSNDDKDDSDDNWNSSDDDDNDYVPKKQPKIESVILKTPAKSPTDTKSYRLIRLPNGIRALLISDSSSDPNPTWAHQSYDKDHLRLKTIGCCPVFDEVIHPHPKGINKEHEIARAMEGFSLTDDNFNLTVEHNGNNNNMADSLKGEERSAICMIVEAGSADDPDNFPGMAHFTEHMMHYGSKTFPGEGKYWNFVRNHGREIGAYTQHQTTAYQFTVNPDFLETAMDIFGNMMAEPTFDKDCAQREVQAVDSEFHLRKHSHIHHIFELLRVSIQKDHPLKKFTCGNSETLLKTNLQTELKKFHKKYYVGRRMTFAIQSSHTLDNLQQIVETNLGSIKQGEAEKAKIPTAQFRPFKTPEFKKLYTIRGDSTLGVVWNFPAEAWKNFEAKPLVLLSTIMNDGRKGSLQHYLFEKGWIFGYESDSAKVEMFQNKYTSLYWTVLEMTPEGVKHTEDIVQAIFAYIDVISKAPLRDKERLWEELRITTQAKFDYCGSGSPSSNTHYTCRKLVNSETGDNIFTSESVFSGNFQEKPFNDVLKEIKASESLYFQLRDDLPGRNKTKFEYLDAEYASENIPNGFTKKVHISELNLPKRNAFVTKRFSIKQYVKPSRTNNGNVVQIHVMIPGLTIPKAFLNVYLISTQGGESPQGRCLTNMLGSRLNVEMNGVLCCAQRAGLNVLIKPESSKGLSVITLSAIGFPEFLPEVVQTFTNLLSNESVNSIDNNLFNVTLHSEIGGYHQVLSNSASLIQILSQRVMNVDYRNEIDAPSNIANLMLQDFKNFHSRFFSSTSVISLIMGNVGPEQASHISTIVGQLVFDPMTEFNLPNSTAFNLPPGETIIRMRSRSTSRISVDGNNAVFNVYQMENSGETDVQMCMIIANLMDGRAFEILRTQEQLGYVVQCIGPQSPTRATLSLIVLTPTFKKSVCHVSLRMDRFLLTFYNKYLIQIKDKDYADSLLKLHLKEHVPLKSVQEWYKKNIVDGVPKDNNKFIGLRKMSLQVVSRLSNAGICKNCAVCSNVEWVTAPNPELEFARAKSDSMGVSPSHFVSDISALHSQQFR